MSTVSNKLSSCALTAVQKIRFSLSVKDALDMDKQQMFELLSLEVHALCI